MGFEKIGDIQPRAVPEVRGPGRPVRGHQGLQRPMAGEGKSQDPCPCGACVRANHGQPAVVYPATTYRPGYELHGVDAARFYEARARGKASLEALKAKLRGA